MRTFKHLTYTDRLKIETLKKEGNTLNEIAGKIRVHVSTIYRELERGKYTHLNSDYTTEERYSPDIADQNYRAGLAAKGAGLKIGNDHKLANYIEQKIIKDQYSPAAVLGEIQAKEIPFETTICTSTLYSYIEKGVFLNVTNKDLPVKGKRKRKYKKVRRQARASRGDSIEKRPKEVDGRGTFGHWEMDTVYGKTKKTLLVLTERLSRQEFIFPIKDRTTESVVEALDRLERKFGKMFPVIFKTITVDNGSEFADVEGMERHIKNRGEGRTKFYFCHAYSSWERGSNENQNKMIRRKHPKGTNFQKVANAEIKRTEEWVNHYPRAIFGYRSSDDVFREQLAAIQ